MVSLLEYAKLICTDFIFIALINLISVQITADCSIL